MPNYQTSDTGVTVEQRDVNLYATYCSGTVAASTLDTTLEYAAGCIYRKTDLLTGTNKLYENVGTATTPVWRPLRVPGSKYTYENFTRYFIKNLNTGITAPTGTAADVNILMIGDNLFEYSILGTQTIVGPTWDGTAGLDWNSMDQTNNDGFQVTNGVTAASRVAFTIGTDPAFFAEATFSIEDVSGTDDCAFGFRKAAAYTANFDDYTDAAVLNVISGAIKIETILNNATTTTTDTTNTWADLATHTLRVNVSSAGVVTYLIDGVAPTVTAAFTFDSGDVVIPQFYFLNDTDVAGAVRFTKWEVGHQ